MKLLPYFESDNDVLNRATRIAIGDILGNCIPFCDGLLNKNQTCMMAGLDYNTPWTRDASINSMNFLNVAFPEVAKNTLLSVCERVDGNTRIGGQYWDAIIWAISVWHYYLVNRDIEFLNFSFETIKNTIVRFENEEFDSKYNLFRGPAVYGDGVAAYPDRYVGEDLDSNIMGWINSNKENRARNGFGLPMFTLSTNCVYFAAYKICALIAEILHIDGCIFNKKADNIKNSINKYFWNEDKGLYDYLIDEFGSCCEEEALGLSFAILFGIADEKQTNAIVSNKYVTNHGVPCLWPSYDRYRIGDNYGRHSGTVWPHAQGYWALAMLKAHNLSKFEFELFSLANKAVRDMQFAEIYHPKTGEIYGGMQENFNEGIKLWESCKRQSWSATAFWSLILYGVIGLKFTDAGIEITPHLPTNTNYAKIQNLPIFGHRITVVINRNSNNPKSIKLNFGENLSDAYYLSI